MSIEGHRGVAKLSAVVLILPLTACASSDPGAREAARAEDDNQDAGRRNVYSADIADDPYVQRQWESGLSALEARCRETGEFCTEAEQLRETVGRAQ
jgi:hypothetical protein